MTAIGFENIKVLLYDVTKMNLWRNRREHSFEVIFERWAKDQRKKPHSERSTKGGQKRHSKATFNMNSRIKCLVNYVAISNSKAADSGQPYRRGFWR